MTLGISYMKTKVIAGMLGLMVSTSTLANDWVGPLVGGLVLGGVVSAITRPMYYQPYYPAYQPYYPNYYPVYQPAYQPYYAPRCRDILVPQYDQFGRQLFYNRTVCD